MSWSKRERGSRAIARASSGETRTEVPRRSTTVISLPSPFILRNRRFASALIDRTRPALGRIERRPECTAGTLSLGSSCNPDQPASRTDNGVQNWDGSQGGAWRVYEGFH